MFVLLLIQLVVSDCTEKHLILWVQFIIWAIGSWIFCAFRVILPFSLESVPSQEFEMNRISLGPNLSFICLPRLNV